MPRRAIVVTTAPDPGDELRERVRDYIGEGAKVLVLAPVSDLSFMEWLANEEDRAREEAAHRAEQATEAVPARVVEARVGDPDPLVAVADALREFPADELIVVTRPAEEATWLERDALRAFDRFGLPVVHLVDDDAGGTPGSRRLRPAGETVSTLEHELAEGEDVESWLVAHTMVLLALGLTVLVVLSIVVLAYILAG